MNEFTDSRAELSSLRDIKDVVVETSVPRRERIRDTDTDVSLQDRLAAYASSMDRASGKLW